MTAARLQKLVEAPLESQRIEPLLPKGRRGAHRVDDRRMRSAARWRDCPSEREGRLSQIPILSGRSMPP